MEEYAFATIKHGQMAEKINEWAEKDFSVDSWVNQGNSFYVLFSKWGSNPDDEDDLSETTRLWIELSEATERIEILEGALALKIKKDSIDEPKADPAE